jgi:hypothetical protein
MNLFMKREYTRICYGLSLCVAYMYEYLICVLHTGSYVFQCQCPSKAEIMYKYKVNVNRNVISRPELYALSNGALCFPLTAEMEAECKHSFREVFPPFPCT